jgi:glycosyltransferase involved in cell wall biosynthesis
MSSLLLSVIICTHNPDAGRLQRVLDSLRAQTLPDSAWELLLVDNASGPPLAGRLDLSWHAHARLCPEGLLGLTWARLTGLAESSTDLLVYVDDDNVLAPDYLATTQAIATEWPKLGAWSGDITPEFETAPGPELTPYLELLALCPVPQDVWCNFRTARCLPRGAGLTVRRTVAEAYERLARTGALRQHLERQGANLSSCGDSDLCFTAINGGLGLGLFHRLRLVHLIPRSRLTIDYLLRLQESMSFSWAVLNYLHDGPSSIAHGSWVSRLGALVRFLALSPTARRFDLAGQRGKRRARLLVRSMSPTV